MSFAAFIAVAGVAGQAGASGDSSKARALTGPEILTGRQAELRNSTADAEDIGFTEVMPVPKLLTGGES